MTEPTFRALSPQELKDFLARGQNAQAAADQIIDAANRQIVQQMRDGEVRDVILQGSEEWHAMRRGKVTASRMADVMAKPRVPGEGMRANYLWQLVCERMTGLTMQTYQSRTMEEAHEWEPIARAAYAFHTDATVREVAFIDHPDIPMCGCSPDGLVGDDGLVQIKCPERTAHGRLLVKRSIEGIKSEYIKQMQWEMACTARKWSDFVSYNEDFPRDRRQIIIRVPRDTVMIGNMAAEVRSFQTEIDLTMSALK